MLDIIQRNISPKMWVLMISPIISYGIIMGIINDIQIGFSMNLLFITTSMVCLTGVIIWCLICDDYTRQQKS